jgi:hypothetical protein
MFPRFSGTYVKKKNDFAVKAKFSGLLQTHPKIHINSCSVMRVFTEQFVLGQTML